MSNLKPTKTPFFIAGWLQFFCLLSLITYLSLIPNPGSVFESFSDKVLHVFGWFSMCISLGIAWFFLPKFFFGAIMLFLYSLGIEVAQQYTGRHFSGLDMLANAVGVTLGFSVIIFFRHVWSKKQIQTKIK